MSNFICAKCKRETNTATSNYWFVKDKSKAICIDCVRADDKDITDYN